MHDSKRTEKKMMRYGLRIWREMRKQKSTHSNNAVKKLAMWWMHP